MNRLAVSADRITPADRARMVGQNPVTVWLTGLSGSGKSTVAHALERRLLESGHLCAILDGDQLRQGLSRDLGFSPAERRENVRRIAEVARLFNDAGLVAIVALISPYREDRAAARVTVGESRFIETYLSASLEVCEGRDAKGLYARARAGGIAGFTGVSAPYEPPTAPEVTLDTERSSVDECVERLLGALEPRLG